MAGCHFTQFAAISGSRWWLWLGLLRGSFCYEFMVHFLFIAELAGQWQALLLVSFGFGGLAVGQCHTSYGFFGLVSCWVRVRLGQCPAQLDSFDLRAGAHERGGLRSELWISPMLRLYVQEGGPFLGLCAGWWPHFGAICIVWKVFFLWRLNYFTSVRSRLTSDTTTTTNNNNSNNNNNNYYYYYNYIHINITRCVRTIPWLILTIDLDDWSWHENTRLSWRQFLDFMAESSCSLLKSLFMLVCYEICLLNHVNVKSSFC